jgi:hypothetical protein
MAYCPPWPIDTTCLPPGWDPTDLTDDQLAAIEIASELLKAASGWVWGPCLVTVRPCAPEGGFPCSGPCGCARVCRVRLPAPVTPGPDGGVVGVVVDGQPLPDTAWRIDGNEWLVRQDGGCFPPCQRLDRPAGEPGTWTVTYWRGWPIDASASRAVTALAARIYDDCQQDGCWIDPRVTQLTRNGVTYNLDPGGDGDGVSLWMTLPVVGTWLARVNPKQLGAPTIFWTPEMGTVHTTTSVATPLILQVTPTEVRPGEPIVATVSGELGAVLFEWGDGEATS